MIKARIATCDFILHCVIEFKYIRHGVILSSIILYLKICQVCDNQLSFFNYQWSPDARSSIIDLVNFDR